LIASGTGIPKNASAKHARAGNSMYSSISLHNASTWARWNGSLGSSDRPPWVCSRYSRITLVSLINPCSTPSTGTLPRGLTAKASGVWPA